MHIVEYQYVVTENSDYLSTLKKLADHILYLFFVFHDRDSLILRCRIDNNSAFKYKSDAIYIKIKITLPCSLINAIFYLSVLSPSLAADNAIWLDRNESILIHIMACHEEVIKTNGELLSPASLGTNPWHLDHNQSIYFL